MKRVITLFGYVGLVERGFCFIRADVQTWSYMLLFKFSAY